MQNCLQTPQTCSNFKQQEEQQLVPTRRNAHNCTGTMGQPSHWLGTRQTPWKMVLTSNSLDNMGKEQLLHLHTKCAPKTLMPPQIQQRHDKHNSPAASSKRPQPPEPIYNGSSHANPTMVAASKNPDQHGCQ